MWDYESFVVESEVLVTDRLMHLIRSGGGASGELCGYDSEVSTVSDIHQRVRDVYGRRTAVALQRVFAAERR